MTAGSSQQVPPLYISHFFSAYSTILVCEDPLSARGQQGRVTDAVPHERLFRISVAQHRSKCQSCPNPKSIGQPRSRRLRMPNFLWTILRFQWNGGGEARCASWWLAEGEEICAELGGWQFQVGSLFCLISVLPTGWLLGYKPHSW